MKISAFLIIILFCVGISAQNGSAPASNHQVSDLEWMAGCWVQNGKKEGSFTSETWTKPYGIMIGTNRTIREGKVVAFEYLRIESRETGVFYVAKPSSASGETGFKLITLEKNRAVFENKEHDFPKRLIYSRVDGKELNARAEDDEKGFDFVFRKAGCDE